MNSSVVDFVIITAAATAVLQILQSYCERKSVELGTQELQWYSSSAPPHQKEFQINLLNEKRLFWQTLRTRVGGLILILLAFLMAVAYAVLYGFIDV